VDFQSSSGVLLPSSARPRVEIYPPYLSSLGAEALDFARQLGMTPDPWQEDGIEIMLSIGDDGLWNCATYAELAVRQNGKGVLGEIRVLAGLYLFKEQGILWSSNRYKASLKAFKRVLGWIEGSDELMRRVKRVNKTHGEEGITLHGPNPKRVTGEAEFACVARSEQSGRSFTIDTNIVDEALAFTEDQAGGLFFAKSAVQNAQTIYLSSPPLRTDKKIVIFKVRRTALSGKSTRLGFRDWGIAQTMEQAAEVDRLTGRPKIDIYDERIWAATNPAYPHRISRATILDELGNIDPVTFARERLGAWPPMPIEDSGDTVIPMAVWRDLLDADSQPKAPLCIGIDVDPSGTGAALVGYALREDGLGHTEVLAARPGVTWVAGAAYVMKELHDCWFVLDAQGPAKSLIPELRRVGIAPPDDPAEPEFGNLKIMRANDVAEAWGGFRDAAAAGGFRHRGQGQLDAALSSAAVRDLGEAQALTRRTSSGSISALVGAAAARWSFYEWVDQIRLPESEPGAWVL
jgi:hypothetical protein